MIYKTLKKVSEYCQLLDKSKYNPSQTINGVTFTNNGDGTFTANGTATANIDYRGVPLKSRQNMKVGHKYLLSGCPVGGSVEKYRFYLIYLGTDTGNGIIKELTNINVNDYDAQIRVNAGTVCDNLVFKPQLFDLTEMYGAGNEPTTVEQFRQDFPEELYDYKPYCFVKSYKNCLKVSDVCQLLDKSKYPATQTIYGVTFTNNGNGSITVNGTCTNPYYSAYKIKENLDGIVSGHKYAILGTGTNMSVSFNASYQGGYIWEVSNNIFTLPENEYTSFSSQIRVTAGVSVSNITVKPQLFDLTEMFGAGNEPTTVEEFRQKFPNELYDYKPYSIVPSYKKSLKVTDSILL